MAEIRGVFKKQGGLRENWDKSPLHPKKAGWFERFLAGDFSPSWKALETTLYSEHRESLSLKRAIF